jgi:hypothetical protein
MAMSALVLALIASNLTNILAKEFLGYIPAWLTAVKVVLLLAAALHYRRTASRPLAAFAFALCGVIGFSYLAAMLARTAQWQALFDPATFAGHFGSAIYNKAASTLPVIVLLVCLHKSPQEALLGLGDLSVKAAPIRWLGVKPDWITWRRLSLFSAFAIAGGTLLLTLLTTTGFSVPHTISGLPRQLPTITLLALVNSISEGFLFRNAVLAPLRRALPKEHLLLIAALFFGLAHFYGVPTGVIGVIMSGVLGWYLARSMYETGGLLAPWIIHFLQDFVIFTTLFLLETFV